MVFAAGQSLQTATSALVYSKEPLETRWLEPFCPKVAKIRVGAQSVGLRPQAAPVRPDDGDVMIKEIVIRIEHGRVRIEDGRRRIKDRLGRPQPRAISLEDE